MGDNQLQGGVAATPKPVLRDARGRVYEPAVGPRLKILLAFIFACVAVLGASGVYLLAIDLLEKSRGFTYTNQFTLWMFLAHVLVGVLLVVPFLVFGFIHLASARRRKNRLAVRLGIALFISGILVGVTGLALIQLEATLKVLNLSFKFPQLPTGTPARAVIYLLHAIVPVAAVALYVLHRRAGPDIKWKWGIAWGGAVSVFVLIMAAMHSQDPRKWYARGSPEGARYFEPSKARTVDGNFIPETALMMDDYCLKCHQDIYQGWFHSAHHFSSFNNPPYLFSVRETRKVSLARDGEVRASRWCAGCHDPVPLFSGQFDNPNFDDVHHPTAQAGITCTVCHAIVNVNSRVGNADYTIEEPQHYPLAYSTNPVLQWLNNQIVKAKPDFHKKTFLKPFHRTEAFCSTCHKVSIPMALNHYKEFLRGQNHNDTFLLSGVSGHGARSFYYPPEAKTNCAQCHMPLEPSFDFGSKEYDDSGVRKVHNHLFPGGNTGLPWLVSKEKPDRAEKLRAASARQADFLRGEYPENAGPPLRIDLFGIKKEGTIDGALIAPLRPRLPALERGNSYLVEVVIRTLTVGHPFTQGTADSNEVWVDFEARSGGKLIGRSGAMDGGEDRGRVDEWSHFVNVLMLDRDGHRIDRRNPQDIFTPLYNHQLPPGAGQVVHYRLNVPPDASAPVELRVRLRYRKFDHKYMEYVYGEGKVPELPVVDLCQDRVTLPLVGGAEVLEQHSPIKPAWQRWNDYGIGCLLEGGADAKKGELRQAEQAFRRLIAEEDRAAHGHGFLNLARVYNAEGRLAEATEALNSARTAEPPAPWWTVAWFTGLVNAQNGHLDEAIASFRQIVDPAQQPAHRKFDFTLDYVVHNELGKTLFERSQLERDDRAARDQYLRAAIDALERTLAIDPEDLDAHYWLAQCYARIGEGLAEPAKDSSLGSDVKALGQLLATDQQPRPRRLEAAAELCRAVTVLGSEPTDPKRPKLPTLNAVREQCLPVYRHTGDAALSAAAAAVLGCIHRQEHAIYRPDDNAQDRTIGLYRRSHPAADHASHAIVIYSLDRPGAPRTAEGKVAQR
jgi:tetratricopeptide (TPR) repeat protein